MLVEVLLMDQGMCLQRETISDIKADIKELQSGMLDLQIKSEGFSDIESLVSQLANLTSWLRWLVILIAGGFITGAIGLIWKLVEAGNTNLGGVIMYQLHKGLKFQTISVDELLKICLPINTSFFQVHHTWRPNHSQWKTKPDGTYWASAIDSYHRNTNKWSAIGEHANINPDGSVTRSFFLKKSCWN